ncbi:pyridine nucleotide-disulfide oxidoreductase [Corynebacterium frankenforstense DSM 45800]|uniref:Pyridine nucleotide-disulfide oxidoreductase n=1 Tax=Corynebacterium frankenforstense DSM 45800 TaxID=1437875 RepID=A0A1L7CQC1_9CORY|nr:FAD-dependent oxidoreductase [Corynebacterium frankenforstense]APT88043.1 pyridine nucleotide-disulfide oxidoreductase [Corynebacterium frankenforstense DSM 45800]
MVARDLAGRELDHEAIVVGGGQSGLATAFYLLRAGVDVLVLDDQRGPGGAWRHAWPSLTLFSTAGFSNLPGTPMPAHDGFPPAAHVVDYLEMYERRHRIPVERPVHVERVEREGTPAGTGFRVRAAAAAGREGREWRCAHVIAATGTWSAPFVPAYPGRFTGRQWHSANYPGPDPFAGRTVAVVGAANSAAQIAAELIEDPDVGEVTWYARHAPRWMPDDVDGRVLFRRNRERFRSIAAGRPDPGADSQLGDIVVLPQVRRMRDAGRLSATPMFNSLSEVDAEHLIWCTGFRPALGPFRGLLAGAAADAGADEPVAGLHLVGYGDRTGPGSATILGVGPYAKAVAREVAAAVGKTGR